LSINLKILNAAKNVGMMLIDVKLKTGKRGQKTEPTGRSPSRR
jgi:hypothetical protein